MAKIKFIDKSKYSECWICNGTGVISSFMLKLEGKKLMINKDYKIKGNKITFIKANKKIGIVRLTHTPIGKKCKACKGTGKWKEDNYHLIYTNKKGQRFGFNVDGIK